MGRRRWKLGPSRECCWSRSSVLYRALSVSGLSKLFITNRDRSYSHIASPLAHQRSSFFSSLWPTTIIINRRARPWDATSTTIPQYARTSLENMANKRFVAVAILLVSAAAIADSRALLQNEYAGAQQRGAAAAAPQQQQQPAGASGDGSNNGSGSEPLAAIGNFLTAGFKVGDGCAMVGTQRLPRRAYAGARLRASRTDLPCSSPPSRFCCLGCGTVRSGDRLRNSLTNQH